jgi:hypothetical protein
MHVILNIPDDIVHQLKPNAANISRVILEKMASQAYRRGILSLHEVSLLLGHQSRWETEDFLSSHDSWPALIPEEAAEDSQAMSRLMPS